MKQIWSKSGRLPGSKVDGPPTLCLHEPQQCSCTPDDCLTADRTHKLFTPRRLRNEGSDGRRGETGTAGCGARPWNKADHHFEQTGAASLLSNVVH